METLERFQQNRRVIEDFTARTLAAIPSDYARLLYVASLRNISTGRYVHEGLSTVYPEEAVQQALAYCHEELYSRILEMPLEQQEWDLRACLGTLEGEFWQILEHWSELEFFRMLVPLGLPVYLRELFCSNLRTLLAVLAQERASLRKVA